MNGHDLFRYLSLAAVLTCYAAILLGGNVMASDSGLACPDWPTCHNSFAPPLVGATGIEWAHRLGALTLTIVIVLLLGAAWLYERGRPVLRRLAVAASAIVVAQAVLGGVVVVSGLAIAIVLLHFALATILFGTLLLLTFLANLREIPPRWIHWAWRATEEGVDPAFAPEPFVSDDPGRSPVAGPVTPRA
jgi:heme A synthase